MIRKVVATGQILISLFLATLSYAQSRPEKLEFVSQPRLVDCHPVSTVPCFTADLNVLDAQGIPTAIDLPNPNQLLSLVSMSADGLPLKVFYANAGGVTTQSAHGRVVLILVDISGSMARRLSTGETRFDAAQNALRQFLDNFQDGVDHVAIVPFESHDVSNTIRRAVFASTRQAAAAQVESLPLPQKRNNTALYSAVVTGLDVLNTQVTPVDSEAMLVVMTDGKNEVFPGDDAGLLDGEDGLSTAAAKVKSSRLPVIGIGFGEQNQIDTGALTRLSTRPPSMAPDAEALKAIFTFTRKLLINRIEVAFVSPKRDLASLAGQNIRFQAMLDLPGGRVASQPIIFETPQMGTPLISGKASVEELKALSDSNQGVVETSWLSLLRPIFVFLALGGLILIAWFGIPRLIWPGQYIGNIGIVKSGVKWAGPVQAGKNAPAGFGPGKAGAVVERKPQDKTVLRPMSDITKTRIRNDFKE